MVRHTTPSSAVIPIANHIESSNSSTSPAISETSIEVKPVSNVVPSIGITLGRLKNLKNDAREKLIADANRNAAIEITHENLQSAWLEVVEIIAADKMLYKSAILESVLTHVSHEITIHANVVSFDFLKSERIRLLDFFKTHYHNEKVNVLFAAKAITTEQTGEQVMSTREIFDMMADKNPNLRILKDKYGMDIEY